MSAVTKALPNPPANFSTTLSAAIASDALTIPLSSVTGLATEGVGAIYAKDSLGAVVASSLEFVHWTNISSLNLTLTDTGDRGLSGSASSAQAHNSGDTFEVWVHPEYHFYDWAVVEHTVAGAHGNITTTGITSSGDVTLDNGKGIVGNMVAGTDKTILALDTDVTYVGNVAVPTVYRGTTHTFWDADGNVVVSNGWFAAGETWTYAGADDPTFTFTISGDKTGKYSAGMRIKLTQTTAKYFIITAVAYGAPNTTVTVYGGTDYDLANAAITSPFYSTMKAPVGFPLDPSKWTVTTSSTANQFATGNSNWVNTATNLNITLPIGVWFLRPNIKANFRFDSTGGFGGKLTYSTANNSESNASLTCLYDFTGTGSAFEPTAYYGVTRTLTMTTKTVLYFNQNCASPVISSTAASVSATSTCDAVCAYL